MYDTFYLLAKSVEAVSFSIMIYGSLIAIFMFLKNEFGRFSGKFKISEISRIRLNFGNYILLGLEFLIAADIIETILKPDLEELIELGGIVIIRVLLSYFLTKEINNLSGSEK